MKTSDELQSYFCELIKHYKVLDKNLVINEVNNLINKVRKMENSIFNESTMKEENLPPQERYEKETGKSVYIEDWNGIKNFMFTDEYLEWFKNWMNTSDSIGLKLFKDSVKKMNEK